MKTHFKDRYAFKGGTCLTKCYLGYYRFSEDLDFTYIGQDEFKGMSQKTLRKTLSEKINNVLEQLIKIADELHLDFRSDKSDTRYVMLGGSNKFVTFKLWYKPLTGEKEDFIKIQINYLELIVNKITEKKAHSLYSSIDKKEMKLLHPEFIDLLDDINLLAYPLIEMFLEKIRAILTRRGTKSRDYIDVYLIEKKVKIDIDREEPNIINKIEFMLRYDKYLQNLSVIKPENLIIGEEAQLLLEPLDEGFKKFLPEFFEYLKKLERKIEL
jgi:predicted nucleotidyltransferase component of viral defense system